MLIENRKLFSVLKIDYFLARRVFTKRFIKRSNMDSKET